MDGSEVVSIPSILSIPSIPSIISEADVKRLHFLMLMLAVVIGCRAGDAPAFDTGFEGIVRYGPIHPGPCGVNEMCDAPFSHDFQVERNGKVVAQFHSNSAGAFQVDLFPGRYTIRPDVSDSLLLASKQTQEVTVGPHGLTHVELEFFTGLL
jgi:hypothetical protein